MTQEERYKQSSSDAARLIHERLAPFPPDKKTAALVSLVAAMLMEIEDLRTETVRQAALLSGLSSPNETAVATS